MLTLLLRSRLFPEKISYDSSPQNEKTERKREYGTLTTNKQHAGRGRALGSKKRREAKKTERSKFRLTNSYFKRIKMHNQNLEFNIKSVKKPSLSGTKKISDTAFTVLKTT